MLVFFFKQKTAYERRISDWSSDVCSSDLLRALNFGRRESKATGTLAASTVALFTVATGRVAITSIYGLVTTAITVANSYKLQHNPRSEERRVGNECVSTCRSRR